MAIDKRRVAPAFEDSRGQIRNLLHDMPEAIVHVADITSATDAVRGNHRHRLDAHYSWLIEGLALYVEVEGGVHEAVQMEPGDLVYTPPGRAHAFYFLRPSRFLAFTTRPRTGGRYEEDTEHVHVLQSGEAS